MLHVPRLSNPQKNIISSSSIFSVSSIDSDNMQPYQAVHLIWFRTYFLSFFFMLFFKNAIRKIIFVCMYFCFGFWFAYKLRLTQKRKKTLQKIERILCLLKSITSVWMRKLCTIFSCTRLHGLNAKRMYTSMA